MTYACTGVTPDDIPCAALNFDGTFDGDTADGTMTFTATSADYTGQVYPPGEYTVTITGTATGSGTTATATTKLTLSDVCNPPTVNTWAPLDAQDYTITGASQTYALSPAIALDPAFCALTVTATIPTGLDSAVTFDGAAQTFALAQITDSLALAGSTSGGSTFQDHTVAVAFAAASPYEASPTLTGSETFIWTVRNPCTDPSYVSIVAPSPSIADQTYIVFAPAETFSHGEFTLSTTPVAHTLCGAITVTASYDGATIGAAGAVLSYAAASREFTVDSDDETLFGQTKPYGLEATLASYPPATFTGATSQSLTKNIQFDSPCDDPFTFEATTQTDPSPYAYTGILTFQLTPFTITPSVCDVAYACQSVTRTDSVVPVALTCGDFSFDGSYDGSTGAGGDVTDG